MTVISVAPTKINRYEDLFREFSWKVINVTRLIFEYSLVKRLQEQDRDGFRAKVEHALEGTTKGVSPTNKSLVKTWSIKSNHI